MPRYQYHTEIHTISHLEFREAGQILHTSPLRTYTFLVLLAWNAVDACYLVHNKRLQSFQWYPGLGIGVSKYVLRSTISDSIWLVIIPWMSLISNSCSNSSSIAIASESANLYRQRNHWMTPMIRWLSPTVGTLSLLSIEFQLTLAFQKIVWYIDLD